MKQIPVALQLYTLRDETARDFVGTLKKVAELGFDGVEFAGFGNLSVQELKKVIDDLGLEAASSHVPIEDLEKHLDRVIEEQQILGSKFIVCPWVPFEKFHEDELPSFINLLNQIGEKCQEAGITFCYHNHDFELKTLANGKTGLESLFDSSNAEFVQAELDLYWLQKAGQDPIEWMKRYSGRAPLIHLKDMTTDEEQFFAELGTGGVDIEGALQLGEECQVQWWIVEQDVSRKTPLESVEISINYLKEKLPYLSK